MNIYRGQVVQADIGLPEPKLFLVVSNNKRNGSRFPTVLGVRLTTSHKDPLPTIVVLENEQPLTGRVLCDEILPLYRDEILSVRGAVGPGTMTQVEAALKIALALD